MVKGTNKVKQMVKKIKKKLSRKTVAKQPSYDIEITQKDKNLVWAFNAGQTGNDFRGNPKYLFIYINKYRKDITAYWLCEDEQLVEFIRNLGYLAYQLGTVEAECAINRTGVYVAEQVKLALPGGLENVKFLNLYHGVGAKDVERVLLTGGLAEGLAKKYIIHNSFYRNNQLFLCPSPMMVDDFRRMCGVDEDKVVRAGYPRNIYQKYFDKIATFDHDLLGKKGLSEDYKIAVYAPTYRQGLQSDTFTLAIPNMKKLIEHCKKNKILFVFKMHPLMENEFAFLNAKENYEDSPYLYFWDNKDDIYEIIDQIDLAIVDYSSIFTDFVSAGVPHYIRYVFDYDEAVLGLNHDYMEVTTGALCYSFDELLSAIDNYHNVSDEEGYQRISDLYWKYSDKDSFEKIIDQTLEFVPQKREFPTLYSFDIFDTLISRKVLAPRGIFYLVQERMKQSDLQFPAYLVENYPLIRVFTENDVREYYHKTLEEREDERREIFMVDIFEKMQTIYNLTDEQTAFLMETEQQEEIENTIPVQENVDYFKQLVSAGETVVLISDMYLPKDIILKMLHKVDPMLCEVPLFLSSEYGVQKTTKKLFLEVYKSFKPFYDFGKWIHIGDTQFPDVTMPRKLGIIANKVIKPEFNEYEKRLVEELDSYDAYLVAALFARFREKHIFDKQQFAYSYASLCFVPYINWVIDDALERGYQTLYFISRDGHHLKRIADEMIRIRGLSLKTKYIYASRRAWRLPSLIDEIDDGFWRSYGNFSGVSDFEKLLKAMGMDEALFQKMFPELMGLKEKEVIEPDEKERVVEILKNSKEYKDYLLAKAKEDRVSVCEYLEQQIDRNEKFAFVEFWGRGYTQDCFTMLWKQIAGPDAKSEFYYSRTILPSQGDNIRYNFTVNSGSQLFIEAIFANMPYKSVESYTMDKDGMYQPDIHSCDYDVELFDDMEKYLIQFTRDYLELPVLNREKLNRELFDYILECYRNYQDDPLFVSTLAPLVDSVALYGKKREFAPKIDAKMLESMQEGEPRGKFTRSMKMSLARTDDNTKQQYLEMYQLQPDDNPNSGRLIAENRQHSNAHYRRLADAHILRQQRIQAKYNAIVDDVQVEKKILVLTGAKDFKGTVFYSLNKELKKQDEYEVVKISMKTDKMPEEELVRLIASAMYIIVAKNMSILSKLKLRTETQIIVLNSYPFPYWKKLLAKNYPLKEQNRLMKMRLDMQVDQLMCPSEKLVPIIKEMYGVQHRCSFEIFGNCATDIYFDRHFIDNAWAKLWRVFPEAEGKKVILYIPRKRVRNTESTYKAFIDLEELREKLGDDYVVVSYVKLLKRDVAQSLELEGFAKNVAGSMILREAICACDYVVGDYRESLFEVPLLHKPVYMMASDWKEYLQNKSIIYPYDEVQIGPLVNGIDELVEQINNVDSYDYSLSERFREKYLTYCDGKSAKRLMKYILKK